MPEAAGLQAHRDAPRSRWRRLRCGDPGPPVADARSGGRAVRRQGARGGPRPWMPGRTSTWRSRRQSRHGDVGRGVGRRPQPARRWLPCRIAEVVGHWVALDGGAAFPARSTRRCRRRSSPGRRSTPRWPRGAAPAQAQYSILDVITPGNGSLASIGVPPTMVRVTVLPPRNDVARRASGGRGFRTIGTRAIRNEHGTCRCTGRVPFWLDKRDEIPFLDRRLRIALVSTPMLPVPPPTYAGTERVGRRARRHPDRARPRGDPLCARRFRDQGGTLVPTIERSLWSTEYRGDISARVDQRRRSGPITNATTSSIPTSRQWDSSSRGIVRPRW